MTVRKGNQRGLGTLNSYYSYLSASWSISIILVCCLIAIGLQSSPIQLLPKATDPRYWPQTWDGLLERVIIFAFTFYLMLKQTDYYYGWLNKSSKSGIFKALGWANTWEVVSDVALGFWGASLLAISGLWPYLWLPAFAIYCVLGWFRCRISLARGKVAKRRRIRSDITIFTAIFSLAPFDLDFDKLAKSIEGIHIIPKRKEVSKKAVLAGWMWSFRMYFLFCTISSLCLLFYLMSVRIASLISTLFSIGILFCHGGLTSDISLSWGEKHYMIYSE